MAVRGSDHTQNIKSHSTEVLQSVCDTVIEMTTDQVDLQKICRTDYGIDDTDGDAGVSIKTYVIITV
jgi:hypothetical protein